MQTLGPSTPRSRAALLLVCPPGVDREVYVAALAVSGFIIETVDDVSSAAHSLERITSPDIVVTDLLPRPQDTWAFVEQMSPTAAVVIFTALIRPDGLNRRRARHLGCAAFLAKPCSPRQLVDVVTRVQDGEREIEVVKYSL